MSPTLRIFISSPGDVVEERRKARQVVGQLQAFYGSRVKLDVLLWEDMPLGAEASFQEGIDAIIDGNKCVDIAVFILWARLGSPLGAMIRKPDGTSYRSGTEREFDIMLAARAQSKHGRPHLLAYVRDDTKGFQQSLESKSIDDMEAMIEQRRLAEQFVREHFHDHEGHNLRAYHNYPEPISFAHRLRVHLREIIDQHLGEEGSLASGWDGSPYRGLEVFELAHAPIFFGREREICEIENQLRARAQNGCGFLVIIGASGSGKSSLARAGVAHSLVNHNLDDTISEWLHAIFLPGNSEGKLSAALVTQLTASSCLPQLITNKNSDKLLEGLRKDPDLTLQLTLPQALEEAGQNERKAGLLLVVDQLEELLTDTSITSEERAEFWRILKALSTFPQIRILATLRSDFYAQMQCEPGFLALKGQDGTYDLIPPEPSCLQRIIREPAKLAGLDFELNSDTGKPLDEEILDHIKANPEALPLLEFALEELYQRRSDSRQLTYAAFREVGGVDGALGRQAEALFATLPLTCQEAFSRVFHSLVTISETDKSTATRRRALAHELQSDPDAWQLVEAFVSKRFLVLDQHHGHTSLNVAHEALLRSWPRLSGWVHAHRSILAMRAHIEQAAQRWLESDRHPSLLLQPGLSLEEAQTLKRDHPEMLSTPLDEFVKNSIHRINQANQRSKRRRATITLALITLTIIATFTAWQSNKSKQQAQASRTQALQESQRVIQILSNLLIDYPNAVNRERTYIEPLFKTVSPFYEDLFATTAETPELLNLQLAMHLLKADLATVKGEYQAALKSLDDAESTAEQLISLDSDDQEVQIFKANQMLVFQRKTSIFRNLGQPLAAIPYTEKQRVHYQQLIASGETSPVARAKHTSLTVELADLIFDSGDFEKTIQLIGESTDQLDELEANHSQTPQILEICSASRFQIAQILERICAFPNAIEEHRKILSNYQHYSAASPSDKVTQIAYESNVSLLRLTFNSIGAAQVKQNLKTLSSQLLEAHPNWQISFNTSELFTYHAILDELANILIEHGEFIEAESTINRAKLVAEQALFRDRIDAEANRSFAIVSYRLGMLRCAQGRHREAAEHFEQVLGWLESWLERNPEDAVSREHDFYAVNHQLGRVFRMTQHRELAEIQINQAITHIEHCLEANPSNLSYRLDHIESLLELAELYQNQFEQRQDEAFVLLNKATQLIASFEMDQSNGFRPIEQKVRLAYLSSRQLRKTSNPDDVTTNTENQLLTGALLLLKKLIDADPKRLRWQQLRELLNQEKNATTAPRDQ